VDKIIKIDLEHTNLLYANQPIGYIAHHRIQVIKTPYKIRVFAYLTFN